MNWFLNAQVRSLSSLAFSLRRLGPVLVKMNFGKMLAKQIFQSLLLLIGIGQLIGWSELYVLADRAISP
jgi:hypothetical protein